MRINVEDKKLKRSFFIGSFVVYSQSGRVVSRSSVEKIFFFLIIIMESMFFFLLNINNIIVVVYNKILNNRRWPLACGRLYL